VVLDNGGGSLKYGLAKEDKAECSVMPNCVTKSRSERRRPFIGNQIEDCRDTSGLFYVLPFQKGYLCAPDTQKIVWDYLFGPECLAVNPSDSNILITEPIFNFLSAQEISCELLFEEYEFSGVCRTTAPHLTDYKYSLDSPSEILCTLVVDSGYSFTHIIPFINGQKVDESVRRIDIGGKVLTNHLKEVLSYRQLHVLDETYLINNVKEELCYITTDLQKDFQTAKCRFPENNIIREYVLPDYSSIRKGFVRPLEDTGTKPSNNEQLLRMNSERFTIPELLFHPSDVGILQMGISEAIISVIHSFPETLHAHFYKSIILSGGNAKIPGFADRIKHDVRKEASLYYELSVHCDEDPSTYAWQGGNKFVFDPEFSKFLVTKQQYNEYGLPIF